MQVAKNGSLVVDERITYDFSGPFSGGFREIPLREGESISAITVSENGRPYRSGGCTELGCIDAPGTFGAVNLGHSVRIVWHYGALDEQRTFDVHYRLSGVAVAYDDVVDINLQVWGSEWDEPLGRLTAARDGTGQDPASLGPSRIRPRRRAAERQERCCCGRSTCPPSSSSSSAP